MRHVNQLLIAAKQACDLRGCKISTLSNKIRHYGTFFKDLETGKRKDVSMRVFEDVKAQLIEMGVDWNGVEHQAKQQEQQRKT